MNRYLAAAVVLVAVAAAAAWPQATPEPEDAGGFLVRFLEDTLSGDGRSVRVSGLEGAFGSRATIRSLTVSDDAGVWLTVTGAVLDWNRLALARGRFSVNRLGADEIVITRAPGTTTTEPELPAPEARPFQVPEFPVAIELGALHVGRMVLGAPVFGVAAELSVDGGLRLADGGLDARLTIDRLDRPGDAARLGAQFDNRTGRVAIDLSVAEQAGGILSAMLRLPGRPRLGLSARGDGLVSDFTADIALASDGMRRVGGQVRLLALPAPEDAPAGAGGTGFAAELAGDVTPLLPPEYRAFFGTEARIAVHGRRAADGRLEVQGIRVAAKELTLDGTLAIAADGTAERVDVRGSLGSASGSAVILPLTGPATAVGSAGFSVRLDRRYGNGWAAAFEARDLRRGAMTLDGARIAGAGQVGGAGVSIGGEVTATLSGLGLADPALAMAAGDAMSISGGFAWMTDGTLRLSGIEARGADYRVSLDGTLDGFYSGFGMQGTARIAAADLSRFSGLAGRRLGGAATVQIDGRGAPLSGMFDIMLDARAQDLSTGIGGLDPLIAGQTELKLDAARGETGIEIRGLGLEGAQLSASASGRLSSRDSKLTLAARLAETNLVVPQMNGPLSLVADLDRTGGIWGGEVQLQGPHDSRAELTGTMAPDGSAEARFDARLAGLERLVPELAGAIEAGGTARRNPAGTWTLDARATGPGGVRADLGGTWDGTTGNADLGARGQMLLNVANLFIAPNSVQGAANFDLRLRGAPSLDAISGTITTAGARFAVPSVAQTVENISATLTLAGRQARVAMTGQLRTGGGFGVNGDIALVAPMDSRLVVDLAGLVLTDNISLRTTAAGQMVYAGPLWGNGTLSGQIEFGETDINLAAVSGTAGAAPIPPMTHVGETAPGRDTRARAGLIAAEPAGSGPAIGLDLRLIARGGVHAHGFGLNAEMGGDIVLRGTIASVEPSGQVELVRGTLNIFGRRLKLTRGMVTLQGDLQPYVEFQSTTNTSEGRATIEISGPLNAPEVRVFAEPQRPSEEALAMLLFGNRFSQLSPLVIAQMAASLSRLGSASGPSSRIRDKTGLDALDLDTDDSGAGRLRAGTYLSDSVYTDFTVNTEGETELNLNLDVTDALTLRGTVDNQGNTGLGVFFERDY